MMMITGNGDGKVFNLEKYVITNCNDDDDDGDDDDDNYLCGQFCNLKCTQVWRRAKKGGYLPNNQFDKSGFCRHFLTVKMTMMTKVLILLNRFYKKKKRLNPNQFYYTTL